MTKAIVRAVRTAVLVTVIGFSSIAHVYAQTERGSFEVGIEVGPSLFVASGGRETIGAIGVSGEPHVDYFLTDRLAVGATGLFYLKIEGAYSHINYHFNSGSPISPYIGARIGVLLARWPNSQPQFGLGPQIGLKCFVIRQFSINLQIDGVAHPRSEGVIFLASLNLGLSYHIK